MRILPLLLASLIFTAIFLPPASALAAIEIRRGDAAPYVIQDVYQRDGVAFVAIDDVLGGLGLSGQWDNTAHIYRITTADGVATLSPGSNYFRYGERSAKMEHRPRFIDGELRVAETFLAKQFASLLDIPLQVKNLDPVAAPPKDSPLDQLFSLLLLQRPKAALDSQWVVAVDPGHGGQDPGAVGANGVTEQAINLAIAQNLQKLLKMRRGAPVVMTRDADYAVTTVQRLEIVTRGQADVLLSLHAQSGLSPAAQGIMLFVAPDTAVPVTVEAPEGDASATLPAVNASRQLAEMLYEALVAAGYRVAPVQERSLLPLGQGNLPRVLVEMGYLTNAGDLARLRDPAQQQVLAQVLFNGLEAFQKKFQDLQEASGEPEQPATQQ